MMFLNDDITNNYLQEILERLKNISELEVKIDELRRFKKEKLSPYTKEVLSGSFDLVSVMKNLSLIADAVLIAAIKLAQAEVQRTMGIASYRDKDGNFIPAELAVIGMGKLGAYELHFSSDLDIIFVYNRNSQPDAGKTNQEIFAKIAQRIISYLTLYTQQGYAYKVDTELRPSGNAGALVTALDPWTQHYKEHAALWEKQALLKSRLIYAGETFKHEFEALFKRLIFLEPFPRDMNEQIHHLRQRIETELAKETQNKWNFKKGMGALMDIEFAIQFLQLKMGKIFPNILTQNTLEAIEKIKARNLLPQKTIQLFTSAYAFYRKIEFYLELKWHLHEGYIDLKAEYIEELAQLCSFPNKKEFIQKFSDFRLNIRNEYLRILKIKNTQ